MAIKNLLGILCAIGQCFLISSGLGRASEMDWKERVRETNLLIHQGLFEEAVVKSLQLLDNAEDQEARAAAFSNLGNAYTELGRYIEAERCLRKAVLLYRGLGGDEKPKLAFSLNNLAVLYLDMQRYGKARSLLKEATVALRQKGVSDSLVDLAVVLNNLGQVERSQRNLQEAEACYREALGILERHGGNRHRSMPTVLMNLGVLYLQRGESSEAIQYLERALEIWQAELGEDHPNVANGLTHLAQAISEEGLFPEAASTLRRALRIAERCLGPEHPRVAEILWDYADVLHKMKQKSQAKRLKKRAKAILARHQKENLLHHTVDWS